MDLGSVLGGKVHVRQHVGLALVDERAELGPFGAQLVSDVAERLAGSGAIGLDERLPERGRDHALLALGDVCLGVAHPMNPAPLPGGADNAADRGLEAFVRV